MILYSVTVNVPEEIHEEWIIWMKEKHVPDVMLSGCFLENKILKLKEPAQDGHTYSFQYYVESDDKLQEYFLKHAPRLQAEHANRYLNKFVAFRTILEII